ncbi:MAG: hypothetical protein KZQ66_09480 [Candidatus Thiodiazotropha sp. (ex Lucinoma aequizonata)]|nr:hypothetical protein [Candidatus Thiodiazotropha sp. (ex Lucinoma aequizonata)]MCU7895916.1 hypothetical protein [Candidatus Thiodiazotropha sp. (ex Lucinoma aequizonata)]MCU7898055.1 hypothetical protein [Candidatus Thiodiazotropha sp. (ex Lucinoma aequizonata)]MCU7902196.1 hypothetical protein [Candidatus Thiodiazotropha sp. (ex Lucinoma aequizonata)]
MRYVMISEDASFDELLAEYYRVWFRFHPVPAVYASVSGYEGLLTADGDDHGHPGKPDQ